jgi:hypothetical protein
MGSIDLLSAFEWQPDFGSEDRLLMQAKTLSNTYSASLLGLEMREILPPSSSRFENYGAGANSGVIGWGGETTAEVAPTLLIMPDVFSFRKSPGERKC